MPDQISIQNIRREAEEIRSAMLAQATQNLFRRLAPAFAGMAALIQRTRETQQTIEFDDNWLAEFSMRRANMPTFVGERVEAIAATVFQHKQNVELRDAA